MITDREVPTIYEKCYNASSHTCLRLPYYQTSPEEWRALATQWRKTLED